MDVGCREVVEDAWAHDFQGRAINRLEGKIDRCRRNLKWWSKVVFWECDLKIKGEEELTRAG